MQEVNDFEGELEISRLKAQKAEEYFERALKLERTDPLQAAKLYFLAMLETCHDFARKRLFNPYLQRARDDVGYHYFDGEEDKHDDGEILEGEDHSEEEIVHKENEKLEHVFYLGIQAFAGIGRDCSYKTAVKYFTYIVNQSGNGDLDTKLNALYMLAFCYKKGVGIGKDREKAIKLYELAAIKGYAPAQSTLGYILEKDPIDDHEEKLLHWYRNAAAQHYAKGQYNLAKFLEQEHEHEHEHEQNLHKAAEQGFASALYDLGTDHLVHAEQLNNRILRAAYRGNERAQCWVGTFYAYQAVQKDNAQAITWFRRGVDQSSLEAIESLAVFYENDNGIDIPFGVEFLEEYFRDAIQKHRKYGVDQGAPVCDFLVRCAQDNPEDLEASYCLSKFDYLMAMENDPNVFFDVIKFDLELGLLSQWWLYRLFLSYFQKLSKENQNQLASLIALSGEHVLTKCENEIEKVLNGLENAEEELKGVLCIKLHKLHVQLGRAKTNYETYVQPKLQPSRDAINPQNTLEADQLFQAALILEHGLGGYAQDYKGAFSFYWKAAAAGHKVAKDWLYKEYSEDRAREIVEENIVDYFSGACVLDDISKIGPDVRKVLLSFVENEPNNFIAFHCLSQFDHIMAMEDDPDAFFDLIQADSHAFGHWWTERLFVRYFEKMQPHYQKELATTIFDLGELSNADAERIVAVLEKLNLREDENLYEIISALNMKLGRVQKALEYHEKIISSNELEQHWDTVETMQSEKLGENRHILMPDTARQQVSETVAAAEPSFKKHCK